jgi:hypothetical protein
MLPEEGTPVLPLPLNDLVELPKTLTETAGELAKQLLLDTVDRRPPTPARFYRIRLPWLNLFESKNPLTLRVYLNPDASLWAGFETKEGMAASFWWKPQRAFPVNWVSQDFDEPTRALLHLTLAAFWRDLCLNGEAAFPLQREQRHYTGVRIRDWGTEDEALRILEQADHVIDGSNWNFNESVPRENAIKLVVLAYESIYPRVNIIGKACLALYEELLR